MKDPNESDQDYQKYLESKAIETLSILFPEVWSEEVEEWGENHLVAIFETSATVQGSSELPEVVNLYMFHPITQEIFWNYIKDSGQGGE